VAFFACTGVCQAVVRTATDFFGRISLRTHIGYTATAEQYYESDRQISAENLHSCRIHFRRSDVQNKRPTEGQPKHGEPVGQTDLPDFRLFFT
jgi:hypothetical protein